MRVAPSPTASKVITSRAVLLGDVAMSSSETLVPAANYRSYCYDERAPLPGIGDMMEAAVSNVADPLDFHIDLRDEAISQGLSGTLYDVEAAYHGVY